MKHEEKLIANGNAVLPGHVSQVSLLVENGKIKALLDEGMDVPADCEAIDALGKTVMPGMIDSHNHMVDPGPYNLREDWYRESCSAASGGITTIRGMLLSSEPTTIDWLEFELKRDIVEQRSVVGFAPWGGLVPSNIKDMKEIHGLGCIGFKGFMCFATNAYPRITDSYPVDRMQTATSFDGLIALRAENVKAADFGYQHYSRIRCEDEACFDDARPWWTEHDAIQGVVLFAKMTGARSEICHTTISQGAEFFRNAKKEGTRVYVKTCPHHLTSDRDVLREKKSLAKRTPPFRSRENVEGMWEYVMDGAIDVIGSDHGPYVDEEKVRANDFWKELCGFGCSDVVLVAMISESVNRRGLSWEKLTNLTSINAVRVLGLYSRKGNLPPGANADFIFIDPNKNWVYDGNKSFSKTKSVKGPYQGTELKGRVTDTYMCGERVCGDRKILCQAGYGAFVKCEV